MNGCVPVGFSGIKHTALPTLITLMIGAVRKNLRFQAHAGSERVWFSRLPIVISFQIIPGVELNSRLIGVNIHFAPGSGVTQSCRVP